MSEHFQLAVIGAGPAGLSAAGRAAFRNMSQVLLEKTDHLADTIYKYQKGKLVMATPDTLPLQSDMSFERGIREDVLGTWDDEVAGQSVNVRHHADVKTVTKEGDVFTIAMANGDSLTADHVVLSIGTSNVRTMNVPGIDAVDHVQYQLDDPDEYQNETIIVIGAGDAAIENAVALSGHNKVTIVNRRDEFARAKEGNLNLVTDTIEKGQMACLYSTTPVRVDPGSITFNTPEGELIVKCDRIIARLGSLPPRPFLMGCGIEFLSDEPTALPKLSSIYESNIPGLFVIGALGGYPLIKQAMNQGFEVVDRILGHEVRPADEPLLEDKLFPLGYSDVTGALEEIQQALPVFSELPPLVFRELMLESDFHKKKKGEVIEKRNAFTNTFWCVLDGSVGIDPNDDGSEMFRQNKGEFFGEMGLISGRRRTATVRAASDALLVEVPRRSMIRVMNSFDRVKRHLDEIAIVRYVSVYVSSELPTEDLIEMAHAAEVVSLNQGEELFKEGDAADSVHLIRRGSVTVSREFGDREVVLSYVPAGQYVGEVGVLSGVTRTATVRAAVATETIKIAGDAFKALLDKHPNVRAGIEAKMRERTIANARMEERKQSGDIIQFLIGQGIGEATDVLLIDESLCTRCNNCEVACAETHQGISRLDREAGPTFANVHVPTSCRHCEHPHCMADCPPDAIHREANGEVFIDDSCIGCGNCERNCPYDVIHMAKPKQTLGIFGALFGASAKVTDDKKVAVKCDMCKDISGGPSCVRACPTGAAIRVSPQEFLSIASLARR